MRLISLTQITGSGEDMYDEYVNTQTETSGAITKTFPVAGFNCVAVLNCEGVESKLTIDGETQTVSLVGDSIKDWWDYWFAPSRRGKDHIFYFPLQTSGNATLTISYPGGTAKCGIAITGVAIDIAPTKHAVNIEIIDYSKVSTDGFGQTYFNPGNWAKRANAGVYFRNEKLDIAYREVVKNRGKACVFDYNKYCCELTERHTSEDGYSAMIVYGSTESFTPTMVSPNLSTATHESKGLI